MKVRVNISIDERLALLARRLDLNVSDVAQNAIRDAVERCMEFSGRCPVCESAYRESVLVMGQLRVCKSCFKTLDASLFAVAMRAPDEGTALEVLRSSRKF